MSDGAALSRYLCFFVGFFRSLIRLGVRDLLPYCYIDGLGVLLGVPFPLQHTPEENYRANIRTMSDRKYTLVTSS